MTVLLIIVVMVVIVVAGIGLSERRQRTGREVESGIVSFRREMRALAPPDRRPRRNQTPDDEREGSEHGS